MSSSSDSTETPAWNKSIICSTVNPACSPATASLKTLAAIDGVVIPHLRAERTVRIMDLVVRDLRHTKNENAPDFRESWDGSSGQSPPELPDPFQSPG